MKTLFHSFIFSILLISCSAKESISIKESPELIEMRKQKAVWESQNIQSYSVDHVKYCYCIDSGKYKLTVKNKVIESVYHIDLKQYVDSKDWKNLKTIDQLYTFLESTLKAKPFLAKIEYDKRGIPTIVSIDINQNIADEEIAYQYQGFVELK
ncbi:DUF6174 domain-containing protein [Aquirufa sp. ROCK2-A2]